METIIRSTVSENRAVLCCSESKQHVETATQRPEVRNGWVRHSMRNILGVLAQND